DDVTHVDVAAAELLLAEPLDPLHRQYRQRGRVGVGARDDLIGIVAEILAAALDAARFAEEVELALDGAAELADRLLEGREPERRDHALEHAREEEEDRAVEL